MPLEYPSDENKPHFIQWASLQLHVLTQNCDDLSEIWLVCWILIGEWVTKGDGIGPWVSDHVFIGLTHTQRNAQGRARKVTAWPLLRAVTHGNPGVPHGVFTHILMPKVCVVKWQTWAAVVVKVKRSSKKQSHISLTVKRLFNRKMPVGVINKKLL